MIILDGIANNTRLGYLSDAPFKIVSSQTDFNALVERLGANSYQFKDEVTSLYIKSNATGYAFSGFFSDGDTWGVLKTNKCARIICDGGTPLLLGDTPSRLEENTQYGYYENVWVKGEGSVASAATYGIYVSARDVTNLKCRVSNILSNTACYGFGGDVTDTEVGPTTSFYQCQAHDLASSGIIGGFYRNNLVYGGYAYNITSTGSTAYGFRECRDVTNCNIYTLTGVGARGVMSCNRVVGSYVHKIDSSTAICYGFATCTEIIGSKAEDLDSTGAKVYGYYSSKSISGCTAYDIASAAESAYGFENCEMVSSCFAQKIDHEGSVASMNAYGFSNCRMISPSYADDIDTNGAGGVAEGFNTCTYVAAVNTTETVNTGNDYIDTADTNVTNKNSVPDIFTV